MRSGFLWLWSGFRDARALVMGKILIGEIIFMQR